MLEPMTFAGVGVGAGLEITRLPISAVLTMHWAPSYLNSHSNLMVTTIMPNLWMRALSSEILNHCPKPHNWPALETGFEPESWEENQQPFCLHIYYM